LPSWRLPEVSDNSSEWSHKAQVKFRNMISYSKFSCSKMFHGKH
jgi:hypothetical protein